MASEAEAKLRTDPAGFWSAEGLKSVSVNTSLIKRRSTSPAMNLTVREPQIQARWRDETAARSAGAGPARKVCDGYANGEIHMGTCSTRCSRTSCAVAVVAGFDSPYVPAGTATACRSSTRWSRTWVPRPHEPRRSGSNATPKAMKWVVSGRIPPARVLGDRERPTCARPAYEARHSRVLADLIVSYVGRQLKPIHWCLTDRTAHGRGRAGIPRGDDPSIYVNFRWSRSAGGWRRDDDPGTLARHVWTTTRGRCAA